MHLPIDMRTGRLSERGTDDTNVHNLLYKLMKPIHFTKTNPALVLLLAIRTNNGKVVEIVHMLMKSMTMTQRSPYTKGRWLQLVLYNRKRCAIFSHILTEDYDNSYPEIPSTEAATWLSAAYVKNIAPTGVQQSRHTKPTHVVSACSIECSICHSLTILVHL